MNTANSVVKIALVAAAAVIGVCSGASAQIPVNVLHAFDLEPENPVAVIRASDGYVYGISRSDGAFGSGTVFRMAPGGRVSILHSFIYGEEGADPTALIQATDGNFYGTTWRGGPQNQNGGTVFKMAADGTLTTLHTFAGADGSSPNGLIQAADGSFYGTTSAGGPEYSGIIFRMTSSGAFTVLHRFDRLTEGARANTLLEAHDGSFYGTTECESVATAFRMSADGIVTVIHTFTSADGYCPSALIQGADGNFYGTSSWGGTGGGTVFRMSATGIVTVLHTFNESEYEGSHPTVALVQAADGSFVGATWGYIRTYAIGTPDTRGTIFRVTADGAFQRLHTFTDNDGLHPGPLFRGPDGKVYGTAGGQGLGTLFSITETGAVTVLHTFVPRGLFIASTGTHFANNTLLQASDGNFYGTTYGSGTYGRGTIFRLTPTGAFSELYSFTGAVDGGFPMGGLVQGRDGLLYGTTYRNGLYDAGTIFRVTLDGHLTTLYWFRGETDGAFPQTALVEGRDGNFYGTTSGRGTFNTGTVFRMTGDGHVTALNSFSVSDGALTNALIQGVDGNFYGTTFYGGSSGLGTVFKMTPDGTVTRLHAFAADGQGAHALPLVQASDGNLYGTTECCGAERGGTVFRMTPDGVVAVLYSLPFDYPSGGYPSGTLVQGGDGSLYGTAFDGDDLSGSVFSTTVGGSFAVLHTFAGWDGGFPQGGLIQATDGNLYGTTNTGGSMDGGVVFGMNLRVAPLVPTLAVAAPAPDQRGVRLTWSGGWGATSYTIRRVASGGRETLLASGVATTSFTDSTAVPGMIYTYVITAVNASGESVRSNTVSTPVGLASRTPTVTTVGDYDGDHRTDVTVYRAPTSQWLTLRSLDGGVSNVTWWTAPVSQDRPVPADYDGDGLTDLAVYRETNGEWFVRQSSQGGVLGGLYSVAWGAPALGDLPVPADYDGDGRADVAVYRGTTGEWFVLRSTDGTLIHVEWGSPLHGDVPVPADYDGDGRADIAVYRGTTGEWFILRSTDGTQVYANWGAPMLSDVPVPADYDGDGRVDIAVYRGTTGEWFIWSGGMIQFRWGAPLLGDVPVPGDYDGDGRADAAVFREQTGEWFISRSSDRGLTYWPFWGIAALGDTVRRY